MINQSTYTNAGGPVLLPITLAMILSGTTIPSFNYDLNAPAIYSDYQNNFSIFGDNLSIPIDMTNNQLLIHDDIKNLINCINEEPADLGVEVSYLSYFEKIRNNFNYELMFYQMITNYSEKIRQSYINLLSMISYDKISPFEESFVINQLSQNNILTQEYALNTISLWNNESVCHKISHYELKSPILQKRLKKILSSHGV